MITGGASPHSQLPWTEIASSLAFVTIATWACILISPDITTSGDWTQIFGIISKQDLVRVSQMEGQTEENLHFFCFFSIIFPKSNYEVGQILFINEGNWSMATSSVSPLWLFGATFWFIILSPSDWWFISIIVSLIYVVRTALFKQKILSSIQNLKFIAELSIMRSCSTMNRFNWSESINLTRSARLNDLTRDDTRRFTLGAPPWGPEKFLSMSLLEPQ